MPICAGCEKTVPMIDKARNPSILIKSLNPDSKKEQNTMKRCKLFILCCLMLIAAVGNGNAEEPKLKVSFHKLRS